MTSLIFGTIWLGHKGFVKHKRDKQRQKNYERWEGLRDEYDEQRKITRESRSLDIQRTGSEYAADPDADRPILTLRDQQEANDARTGWRPQEAWDGPVSRRTSVEVIAGSGLRPVARHKTGSTWDEDLPPPPRVSRRNWDDYQASNQSGSLSRSGSVRVDSHVASGTHTPRDERSRSRTPSAFSRTASPRPERSGPTTAAHHSRSVSAPVDLDLLQEAVEPIENPVPGGKMAELIELGGAEPVQPQPTQPVQLTNSPPLVPYATGFPPPVSNPSPNPFVSQAAPVLQPLATGSVTQPPPIQPVISQPPLSQPLSPITEGFTTSQPFSAPYSQPFSQPLAQPTAQPTMSPMSPTFPPTTSQAPSQPFAQPQSQPFGQASPGTMDEWWNRP
ncbi:hypothetical protein KCU88_g3059, partial [Aureobasidium melanogenum]